MAGERKMVRGRQHVFFPCLFFFIAQHFKICILKIGWEGKCWGFLGNKTGSRGSACHLIIWICSRWHGDALGNPRSNSSFGVWGLNEWMCPRATCKFRTSWHKRWMRNFLAFFFYSLHREQWREGRGCWEIKRKTRGQGLNVEHWEKTFFSFWAIINFMTRVSVIKTADSCLINHFNVNW